MRRVALSERHNFQYNPITSR